MKPFGVSKKARIRSCPAAGREITAIECAEGRHTVYSCPETGPFNAFAAANYHNFRGIEQAADEKFFNPPCGPSWSAG